MPHFTHYSQHTGSRPDKFYKATLFASERLMLGLNCLDPGQVQPVHDHAGQDKFYCVVEGRGEFVVGEEARNVEAGGVVWAPAGVPHGVRNSGTTRLVVLMGIAPWSRD